MAATKKQRQPLEVTREKKRRYVLAHQEQTRAYAARFRARNRDRLRLKNRDYRARVQASHEAHAMMLQTMRAYRAKHREMYRVWGQRQIDMLSDAYIAKLLGIKKTEAPPDLIESKRAILRVQRLLGKHQ